MIYLRHEDFEEILTQGFKNILAQRSFRSDDVYEHAFYKEGHEYKLWCSFTGVRLNMGYLYSMPSLDIQFQLIDNYWHDLANKVNIQITKYSPTITILPIIEFPKLLEQPWYVKIFHGIEVKADEEGAKELIKRSFEILDGHLFPADKKYLDLREIDKFVNAEVKYREYVQGFLGTDGTEFKRIIIAKLVGSPIYDELVTTYRGYYDWYINKAREPGSEHWGNYPKVFETLFERLKDVKPLENPVIS